MDGPNQEADFQKVKAPQPVALPEVPLADSLLLDVPLLEVPLAEVPQPLDPEPMDPEVAEQESSWRMMSNMSLDRESLLLMSLLFPSPRGLACENTNVHQVPLSRLIEERWIGSLPRGAGRHARPP